MIAKWMDQLSLIANPHVGNGVPNTRLLPSLRFCVQFWSKLRESTIGSTKLKKDWQSRLDDKLQAVCDATYSDCIIVKS